MKNVLNIIIRASKNVSGLVKVTVTSPAGLMKFFLNVEPCGNNKIFILMGLEHMLSYVLIDWYRWSLYSGEI